MNAIFLTREDKRKANGSNAIFLNLAPSIPNADKWNDNFVVVQGVFVANNHGHLGLFTASLYNVDRIVPIKTNLQ
jgi:hypothetical protein